MASISVESAIYPATTLSFTVSDNAKECTNNYSGMWVLQNQSSVNVWISPFPAPNVSGTNGGIKLLPTSIIYFKPREILGTAGDTNNGTHVWIIAESGSKNVVSGWVEQY